MKLGRWIRRRRRTSDEAAFDSACVSLTTQVPRPTERRADPRVVPLLPAAKLVREGGESLCRIHNMSAGGLLAELAEDDAPPEPGEIVVVELRSDRRLTAGVAWVRGQNIGLRFAAEVDLRTIFSGVRPRIGYRPRPPRLDLRCTATVRIDGVYHKVEVQDISAGGMKVALTGKDLAGKEAVVTVENLPPVRGEVRWRANGMAGIAFDRMLSFDELARWLGKRIEVASVLGR